MSCCLCCLPKSGSTNDKTYKKLEAEEKTGSYGATSANQYTPPAPKGGVASKGQGQVNKAQADFDEIWAAYDVDGDGTVDCKEALDTLQRIANDLDEEKVAILVSMITGGKDRMDKEDLKQLLDVANRCATFPQLEKLLTSDYDKSGSISKEELGDLLGLDESQAAELLAAVDEDGDGNLSVKEILKAFAPE